MKFAKSFELRGDAGRRPSLYIDGEQFPYHVAEEGPLVENRFPGVDLCVLWIPVVIEQFTPGCAHELPGILEALKSE